MNKELNLAYQILKSVIIDKSYVSIELNKKINTASVINTSLVTKIVYGVLEKDISLTFFVSKFIKKQPKEEIFILLKMVAFCKTNISSIPEFALVSEIVDISKKIDIHISGFVNAVSKKILSAKFTLPDKEKDYIKYLSVRYNYPEWVISELLKTHDKKFVEELVSTELTSRTHIRVNLDKISSSEFKEKLQKNDIEFNDSLYDYTMYVDYAKLLKCEETRGLYFVQGLPSIVTCNVINAKQGLLLDACASPGGKSVFLAQNRNLSIYSCDIHKHRVDLIKTYAKNAGVNLQTFVMDATKPNKEWFNKFDYVLCDVPCSNLGVSRKKPDVFLNKSIDDVRTLSGIQFKILENCSNYVKSNGVLQYSTCTILDKENKDVINKFLKNHRDFELVSIDFGKLNVQNDGNLYTFYPNLSGTEGFFVGKMVRK